MATIGKTLFAHFRQVVHASAQYDQAITVFHRLKKRLEVSNLCSLSWDQTVTFSDLAHGLLCTLAGSHFSLLRSLLSLFSSQLAAEAVAGYTNTNGLFLVVSYALHLLCFRVVLASFTLTTIAVGNTSEGFAFVLSPWSI